MTKEEPLSLRACNEMPNVNRDFGQGLLVNRWSVVRFWFTCLRVMVQKAVNAIELCFEASLLTRQIIVKEKVLQNSCDSSAHTHDFMLLNFYKISCQHHDKNVKLSIIITRFSYQLIKGIIQKRQQSMEKKSLFLKWEKSIDDSNVSK